MKILNLFFYMMLVVFLSSCDVNPSVGEEKFNSGNTGEGNGNSNVSISSLFKVEGLAEDTVGNCVGPFKVSKEGTLTETTSLLIKGGNAVNFFSDSVCSSTISTISFSPTDTQKMFYLNSNLAQDFFIILEQSATESISHRLLLNPQVPFKIKITGNNVLGAGSCSQEFQVQLVDLYENVITPTEDTPFTITGLSSSGIYEDSLCGNSLSAPLILAGESKLSFYLKDDVKEAFEMMVTSGGLSMSMGVIVTSGVPSKLSLAVPTPLKAGECSQAGEVRIFDVFDNLTITNTNLTVDLNDPGLGRFYTTSDCSGADISQVDIAAGQSEVTIYYRNQKAEEVGLTASSTGLTQATQTVVINPEKAKIININANLLLAGSDPGTAGGSQDFTAVAGTCHGPLPLVIQDIYFNPSSPEENVIINLSDIYKGGNGRFYSDAACSSVQSNNVTFSTSESIKNLYYRGTRLDLTTVHAETTAPLPGEFFAVSAQANAEVIGDIPARLQLAGPGFFYKDECTPVFTIYLRDQYDNLSSSVADLNVSLASAIGTGDAYSDSSCSAVITNVLIPTGSDRATFYIKVPNVETIIQEVTTTGGILPGNNVIAIKDVFTQVETWLGYLINYGVSYFTTGTPPVGLTNNAVYAGYDVAGDTLKSRFYYNGELKYSNGYLYYPDRRSCVFYKIDPVTWTRVVVAGQLARCGYVDGFEFTTAQISSSISGRFDVDSSGDQIYFSDRHSIRTVNLTTGRIDTLAGQYSVNGNSDATGAAARFYSPQGVQLVGNDLYIADISNNSIRKLNLTTLEVSTIISSGISQPRSISYNGTDLYFLDRYAVMKYDLVASSVSVFAGSQGTRGDVDGVGTAARFGGVTSPNYPYTITSNNAGTELFVAETGNATVRKINISTAEVTTIAGTPNTPGNLDGTGSSARLGAPYGLGVNTSDNKLFVLDGYSFGYNCGTNTSENYYMICNSNLREIDLSSNLVVTRMGPTNEFKLGNVTSQTRATAPIRTSYTDGVASDGSYLYLGGNDGWVWAVKLGADTEDVFRSVTRGNLGNAPYINSQQFFNNNYYYIHSGYIRKRTVVDGVISSSFEDLAGNGTTPTEVIDGFGTDAKIASAYWASVDPVNQIFYFTDSLSNICYLRKMDLSNNTVVTVKNLGGRTASNGTNVLCANNTLAYRPIQVGDNWYYSYNYRIFKLNLLNGDITNYSGVGAVGFVDGNNTTARFIDSGNVWCTDQKYLYTVDYSALRRVLVETGEVETISGDPNLSAQQDGAISSALYMKYIDNHGTYGTCAITKEGLFVSDGIGAVRRVY